MSKLPTKYSLSRDGTRLTVFNVCRDCADNTSDLQVLQCNVSNQHGYAFAAGYLNVLRTTFHNYLSCLTTFCKPCSLCCPSTYAWLCKIIARSSVGVSRKCAKYFIIWCGGGGEGIKWCSCTGLHLDMVPMTLEKSQDFPKSIYWFFGLLKSQNYEEKCKI